MRREFEKLAVVNRGEAAMRCIHAVREFNREHGTEIGTVVFYTDPDRGSKCVREADEAYRLGPAMFVDPKDGSRKSTYFDYARLEEAFAETGADAAWVGWGLVAEQPEFVDLCDRLGVTFLGPTASAMRRLGDKISAKRLAEEAGLPVAPWSGGPVETPAEAARHADRLGYPLMVKASAGGGGRGIRLVRCADELESAFAGARAEALRGFGDGTVFLEALVRGARHVEVQIIADAYGETWAVGVRDCSVQRRKQKVFEESASVALTPEQDRGLREASVRLARLAGYRGAGTVEFLYDPEGRSFAFMEVNARLQVEHPVTELTTRIDLVKLQLHVARGGRLEGAVPAPLGHAIEARLNAEDPANDFAPAPGRVELFRMPTGPGIRVDTGVEAGDVIAPEFDSMIAKIVAVGGTRAEALARLRRAVSETAVVIRGGTTNKSFLMKLLEQEPMRTGDVSVDWVDGLAARGDHDPKRYAEVALVQAAVAVYDAELALERQNFYVSAARFRPAVRAEVGRTAELVYRGAPYRIGVRKLDHSTYRLSVDGREGDAVVERLSAYEQRLTYGGAVWRVVASVEGDDHVVEVNGFVHRITRGDRGMVRALAPAVVVSYAVRPGQAVAAGDLLATLEAMKMEVRVTAPYHGRVTRLLAMANVQVSAGTPLLQLEPEEGRASAPAGPGVAFERLGRAPRSEGGPFERRVAALEELFFMLLGYDVDASGARRLADEVSRPFSGTPEEDAEILRLEDVLLATFADISYVFPRQPSLDDPDAADTLRAQAYLVSFLRGLDERDKAIPPAFFEGLRRALRHYRVASLERSQALEEALLWLYKSHVRVQQQVGPISAILTRRLERPAGPLPAAGEPFRDLLDRLIAVTEGEFPSLNDLARDARYELFDRALYEEARRADYGAAEAAVAALAADPDGPRREAQLRTLVDCPQPVFAMLIGRIGGYEPRMRQTLTEALLRRYYRIRTLEGFGAGETGGHSWSASAYEYKGRRIHLIGAWSTRAGLPRLIAGLSPDVTAVPEGDDVVLDFYVWRDTPRGDADATAAELGALLAAGLPRPVRRVVVALAGPDSGLGSAGLEHYTFRPDGAGGFAEDARYRGMHPMLGKRLNLWRLSNFAIERLPSPEDVYLFRGVARDNPKDERLFAVAEVRALTPRLGPDGRVVGLPHLERMLLEALACIRRQLAARRPGDRLFWNRVLLYVWPPMRLTRAETAAIVRRLAPATEGLGLEAVVVRCRMTDPKTGELRDTVMRASRPGGKDVTLSFSAPTEEPLRPIGDYEQKVVRLRRIGLTYPYEVVRMLTPDPDGTLSGFPRGEFVEYDLEPDGRLAPVDRPHGKNTANVIVGVIRNFTTRYPEGMTRVALLGDPSREMGSLAEPECRRILGAVDLAERMGVPLEWFPVSAGAKISMESGTENMDWIAVVLRRLIEFTQRGGEVNLVVSGINVGAQPYWNAEATMLMHTRGILVMTPEAALVLTGKRALDYSGSVSADDNFGIGGYDRVMGPNGQAQYWARDIAEAAHVLLRHYEHTYVAPGERFPRRARTADPTTRDVRAFPHGGEHFARVGDVFADAKNPGRKKPFDIRRVMRAASDQDFEPLERWADWRDAENAVVWDAHVGGYPVCMLGFESRPVPRLGAVPADGPEAWTSGTLFPQASRKIARAINAASGNRPLVVLANLSGFDGSPESMLKWQLEYGAEIGRAVTNFDGPIVFVVVSRYHGGAFVVFSKTLNPNMEVVALEGTYASVIGGAPAAAVVFSREVDQRTASNARVKALQAEVAACADEGLRRRLAARLAETAEAVRSEMLGQVAEEFDAIHSVERALRVGSLDRIIPAAELRPYLVDALERGTARAAGAAGRPTGGRARGHGR